MGRPRVLSIGAAVQDVFLQGAIFAPRRTAEGFMEQFVPGSKNEVENVVYSTGGGASNAAVTFARHGFRSSFLGRIGRDVAGRAVMEALHRDGVQTKAVSLDDKQSTGYSVLLLAPSGERTILTYRGASEVYNLRTRQLAAHKADWYYISSLAGDFSSLRMVLRYAHRHGIKVAINPGKDELRQSRQFKELLPLITLLSVNKQEAQMLFAGDTSLQLIRQAAAHLPMVIITDGPQGSVATDGQQVYHAGMYKNVPVIDRTGAGDAFSSGFTASLIAGEPMERALVFASASSTSVVGYIGAKTGILTKRARLQAMPIVARPLHP
jgi:sugar/nucleoside kinase (ribokinase family)